VGRGGGGGGGGGVGVMCKIILRGQHLEKTTLLRSS